MPGETTGEKVAVPDYATSPRKIGTVLSHEEFDLLCVKHQSRARELSAVRTISDRTGEQRKYTLAFVENFGVALYSHQDASVWALDFREMIEVARAAGVDKELPLIIVPGREVHHA